MEREGGGVVGDKGSTDVRPEAWSPRRRDKSDDGSRLDERKERTDGLRNAKVIEMLFAVCG